MSVSILKRTVSGVDDNRLVLANGEALRQLAYLDSWTTVRIGLRISCELSAAIAGSPRLAIGLSSVAADGFGSPATGHFVGAHTAAASVAYSGTSPHYADTGIWKPCVKVGGTTTDGASIISTADIPKASDLVRQAIIVEITKGSPDFTVQMVSMTNITTIGTDVTDTILLDAMQASDMAGAAAGITGYEASTIASVAVDEDTNGLLDSIDIFWDRSTTPMEISEIRHRKVA